MQRVSKHNTYNKYGPTLFSSCTHCFCGAKLRRSGTVPGTICNSVIGQSVPVIVSVLGEEEAAALRQVVDEARVFFEAFDAVVTPASLFEIR